MTAEAIILPKYPNFFIVGTVRGGTTWLHRRLRAHPQVFMCEPKEPHYYSGVHPRRKHIPHVLETRDYRGLFAGVGDQIAIGDASTSYLWSDRAAEQIHRDVPAARIIAVLRDPIDRAYSHYLLRMREGAETKPFYEALHEDWHVRPRRWDTCDLYVDLGLYYRQVKRYFDVFGRDQVLVLSFGEIRRTPEDVIARIAAFLDIDPTRFPGPGEPENAYARPANEWARRILGNQTLRLAVRALPYGLRRTIKERVLLRRGDKPALDRRSVAFLAPLFAEDLTRLRRLLGRPLPELSLCTSSLTAETESSHAG